MLARVVFHCCSRVPCQLVGSALPSGPRAAAPAAPNPKPPPLLGAPKPNAGADAGAGAAAGAAPKAGVLAGAAVAARKGEAEGAGGKRTQSLLGGRCCALCGRSLPARPLPGAAARAPRRDASPLPVAAPKPKPGALPAPNEKPPAGNASTREAPGQARGARSTSSACVVGRRGQQRLRSRARGKARRSQPRPLRARPRHAPCRLAAPEEAAGVPKLKGDAMAARPWHKGDDLGGPNAV
jgi:hypothetical protein